MSGAQEGSLSSARGADGRRVVVIGGGLAGITAALDLAQAGARVTLVEVRRRLGGAAYSVTRGGLEMDNGQHVFLRCCTAYRALLEALGSSGLVRLQDRLDIPVLKPGAAPARITRSRLPAPLHLARALLTYPYLSPRERIGAGQAALALRGLAPAPGKTPVQSAEEPSLGSWLASRGQGADAQAALWDLIALPTLNLRAVDASLSLGAFVFREGLLAHADAGDIGFHAGTLSQIIAAPAAQALQRAGVRVLLGYRAETLRRSEHGYTLHGSGQEPLRADAAVVALPHERAAGLLEPLLGARAARWRGLGASPIVNLHVLYDRKVLDERFAAGVGTPVQYLFDRTRAGGAPPGTQYLAVSLSGAEREMQMSVQELRAEYQPALAELLPRARGAGIQEFLVTREHAATFRAAPGTAALRPAAASGVPGLALAGAWTATDWPATLEGAVRSGHAAARHVLGTAVAPAGALAAEQSERPTADAAPATAAGAR